MRPLDAIIHHHPSPLGDLVDLVPRALEHALPFLWGYRALLLLDVWLVVAWPKLVACFGAVDCAAGRCVDPSGKGVRRGGVGGECDARDGREGSGEWRGECAEAEDGGAKEAHNSS